MGAGQPRNRGRLPTVKARTHATLLTILLLTLAATGCSDDTSPAHATPTTSTPPAAAKQPWDPCSIPDDAVRAAGLRTETKNNESPVGSNSLPEGWKICYWDSAKGWYRLTVHSTSHTIDQVKSDGRVKQPQTVNVGGKQGFQYLDKHDNGICSVAVGYGTRTVITAAINGIDERPQDDCVEAVAIANIFEKHYREHQ